MAPRSKNRACSAPRLRRSPKTPEWRSSRWPSLCLTAAATPLFRMASCRACRVRGGRSWRRLHDKTVTRLQRVVLANQPDRMSPRVLAVACDEHLRLGADAVKNDAQRLAGLDDLDHRSHPRPREQR